MSFTNIKEQRRIREEFARKYAVPESQRMYIEILKEDAKRREEWKKRHPILAALFG